MWAAIARIFSGDLFGALERAYTARLAAQNDSERIAAEVSIKRIEGMLAVRQATAGFWEMRAAAAAIAWTFAAHLFFIGVGTTFAAPLGWSWLAWTTRIPAFPKPIDEWEAVIVLSFFGLNAISTGVKAIAGAIARR